MSALTLSPQLLRAARPQSSGSVTGVVGLTVNVQGVNAGIGELVSIETRDGATPAEVVSVETTPTGVRLSCMPIGAMAGIRAGLLVRATGSSLMIPVGEELRGRVLDGLGNPLDGGPALTHLPHVAVEGSAPNPLQRGRVDVQLSVGVRAVDTLVPLGRGQRIGIFAGSGVGKSSLLSMIARGTEASVERRLPRRRARS